jgi:hypothetical protein
MQRFGYRRIEEIIPGQLAERFLGRGQELIPLLPIQKERPVTRSRLLHSNQPLAVRAKSKSSRIARQIVALAGIQKKPMPMTPVEGPELVKVTPILQIPGILFHPHRSSGDITASSALSLKPARGLSASAGAAVTMPGISRIHITGDL